jgi:DNA-binding Xre family transcriptional regulator
MTTRKGRIGSRLDDFLKEEGTYDETTARTVKRVLAWQLEQAMAKKKMSKNQMAKAMRTSRSRLDRILSPDNERVQLDTIIKAAHVLGHRLRIELV